jgi:hypothetical protein
VQLVSYLAMSLWLVNYSDLMFKISRSAKLELDICGNESVRNMQEFTKINISNFSFLATALACRVAGSALLVIQMMGLLDQNSHHGGGSSNLLRIVMVLDSASFIFLLVACSLQLYKWIMIILRVQYFGRGQINSLGYRRKLTIGRTVYICVATTVPFLNFLTILFDNLE